MLLNLGLATFRGSLLLGFISGHNFLTLLLGSLLSECYRTKQAIKTTVHHMKQNSGDKKRWSVKMLCE